MNLYEEDHDIIRSSRSQMFLKIGALKKFTTFTGEHLCWTLFLIKLLSFSPATLFKRDSQTVVFLCTLCENFNCTFFLQNTSGGCFFIKRKLSCMSVFFNLTFSFGYLSNADFDGLGELCRFDELGEFDGFGGFSGFGGFDGLGGFGSLKGFSVSFTLLLRVNTSNPPNPPSSPSLSHPSNPCPHPPNMRFKDSLFFRKKYQFDFFADVFFHLLSLWLFLTITRL